VNDIKLKADERRALEALDRGEVHVAKNRKHFLTVEERKLSERYLDDSNGVKIWKWRLTAAGREWLKSHLSV